MALGSNVSKVAGQGWKLRKLLAINLVIIFLGVILINSFIIMFNETPEAGIIYIGERLLAPTISLNDATQKIVDTGSWWINDTNTWYLNLWHTITNSFSILGAFITIYFWLKILAWIAKKLIIQDDSRTTTSYLVAIIVSILLQLIALLIAKESIMIFFSAFKNFALSILILVPKLAKFAERFSGTEPANITNASSNLTI